MIHVDSIKLVIHSTRNYDTLLTNLDRLVSVDHVAKLMILRAGFVF